MSKIIVLLATYNGEKYLKEQLESLFSQTHKNFSIIARDDGSKDKTMDILKSYNIKIIHSRVNIGAKESFSALLEYAVSHTDGEHFMFSDQDDIWHKNKIEKTLIKMQEKEKLTTGTPILIHTNLKIVDENINKLSESFMSYQGIDAKFNKINNLLIQNTITGCTVMINRKLANLCLPIPTECIMHDWWIGLVASKFGKIGYLNHATIDYRQHTKNSVGAKKFNLGYILKHMFKSNSLSKNISQAKAFLDTYRNKLDKDTIQMVEDFSTIEAKSFWQKRKILLKYNLLKQGLIRNIGLLIKI